MFWKGRVSIREQLQSWWRGDPIVFASDLEVPTALPGKRHGCELRPASLDDCAGIAKLINRWFEPPGGRAVADVTPEWIRGTFLKNHALWIVAKDTGGTVRGCVASFMCVAPYPNALAGCGFSRAWGIVDWYCVDPMWREKGVGSGLLETLDVLTYAVGRKAHVFLKEGIPLPLPNMPVYGTVWWVRLAGNANVARMREGTGLAVWPFHARDRETGVPLVRVEGIRDPKATEGQIKEWEDALDNELPPTWVFVSSVDRRDAARGWRFDSVVWMYGFRWCAGKWFGDPPNAEIL
jgi:GNAT superfamily N-acetyltransferase